MRSRLAAFLAAIKAKLRSWHWWVGFMVPLGWWLADTRWKLAGQANDALDKWAIPVIPGLLGVLLVPSVVVVGFVLLLIAHAYWMSLKDTQTESESEVNVKQEAPRPSTHTEQLAETHPVQPPPVHLVLAAIEADKRELPNLLQEELRQGEMLLQGAGSYLRLAAIGHPSRTTEEDVLVWEERVKVLLTNHLRKAARFMSDVPDPTIRMTAMFSSRLAQRLNYRLATLENIIKGLSQ